MGIYFGTDGLRGVYGEEISPEIAFSCANSLSRLCEKKKVIIGRDTRTSGAVLSSSFSSGLMSAGVDVVDIGIATTPIVAFLTKELGFDFGVVISASHNAANYNGIKLFDKNGYKLTEEQENQIERKFIHKIYKTYDEVGRYDYKPELIQIYEDKITKNFSSFDNLKIVLDCANGASYKVAKEVFEKLNAEVICLSNKNDGMNINNNCGALHPEQISQAVKEHNADVGFAFDGDADRIMCCSETGEVYDGDDILFLLANYSPYKMDKIVGTSMTNKGLENALLEKGITLLRADVGDKYVVERMKKENISLGGEPSGHIIIHKYATTGDGVLSALTITGVLREKNKTMSQLVCYKKFPQIMINVVVKDKYRILNSDKLASEILLVQKEFENNGRVLVRASGTEPKIRIMCEHIDENLAKTSAEKLEQLVLEINEMQK